MPSVMISASFIYPFKGSRVVEPTGLTDNVDLNWSRLHLIGDIATDIPPNTVVLTDQGWLLPSSLVSRSAYVIAESVGQTINVNGNAVTMYGQKSYRVLSVAALPQGEAQVDQVGSDEDLGGDPNSPYFPIGTQDPPEEVCECVFLNQQCGAPHENLNDLVSFSF